MQDEKTKLETVKQKLAEHFKSCTTYTGRECVRLRVDYLTGSDMIFLGEMSLEIVKNVEVKRSGTGLTIIVTI